MDIILAAHTHSAGFSFALDILKCFASLLVDGGYNLTPGNLHAGADNFLVHNVGFFWNADDTDLADKRRFYWLGLMFTRQNV